jgi:stage III sporulation protein AF
VITVILNLFPSQSYAKYIKLFAGLLLIMTVLNPFIKIVKGNIDINKIIEKYNKSEIKIDVNLEKDLKEIETKMYERAMENNEEASTNINPNN